MQAAPTGVAAAPGMQGSTRYCSSGCGSSRNRHAGSSRYGRSSRHAGQHTVCLPASLLLRLSSSRCSPSAAEMTFSFTCVEVRRYFFTWLWIFFVTSSFTKLVVGEFVSTLTWSRSLNPASPITCTQARHAGFGYITVNKTFVCMHTPIVASWHQSNTNNKQHNTSYQSKKRV